jgi:hypothetical protein
MSLSFFALALASVTIARCVLVISANATGASAAREVAVEEEEKVEVKDWENLCASLARDSEMERRERASPYLEEEVSETERW